MIAGNHLLRLRCLFRQSSPRQLLQQVEMMRTSQCRFLPGGLKTALEPLPLLRPPRQSCRSSICTNRPLLPTMLTRLSRRSLYHQPGGLICRLLHRHQMRHRRLNPQSAHSLHLRGTRFHRHPPPFQQSLRRRCRRRGTRRWNPQTFLLQQYRDRGRHPHIQRSCLCQCQCQHQSQHLQLLKLLLHQRVAL